MASDSNTTRFDKKIQQAKNHRGIALVLVAGVLVIALGQLTGAVDSILSFAEKVFAKPSFSSIWNIQVYHFQNFDRLAEERKLGERFSGLILNELVERDLDVGEGRGGDSPDIVTYRGESPEHFEKYRHLVPFVSVTGYMEKYEDEGEFRVYVRVSAIHPNLRRETLMLEELRIHPTDSDMKREAVIIARKIYEATQNLKMDWSS